MSGTEPHRRDDWLRRHAVERERPWALEEQLVAPSRVPERERRLAALAARILEERAQLIRRQDEVQERIARLAALEEELHDLVGHANLPERPREITEAIPKREAPPITVDLGTPNDATDREYWLCRCHGFRVESGDQTVGTVEGVRYASSATRPDLIEVRPRRFGRRSLLIPVDEVEDIFAEEETLLVNSSAVGEPDVAHALLTRLRERFGHQVAT